MKTYLVVTESVVDYEASTNYQSFIRQHSAVQALNEKAKTGRKIAEENGWESMQNNTFFETYEEGYYAQNHYSVEIIELECEGYIDLKVDAIKEEERELFIEAMSHCKFTIDENEREVYLLPEEDEDGYDILPAVLCELSDGSAIIKVRRIVRVSDNYYKFEGKDEDGYEYSVDFDDLECGHLDHITNHLH